ncbi:MAG: sigma-70 family RNA polymerase sigma factor [Coriobacteriia bacterium]|nr:sigma-70 family RNA polymerase sigma factor [Coriobacteriia bacterium]
MARPQTDEALVLRAQRDDMDAEQELVSRYSLLVATIISREGLISRTGTQDDLVQHGYIGLLSAIRTYRLDMGAAFKTYASTCIRNEMISALRSESSKKHGTLTTAASIDDENGTENHQVLSDTAQLTPEERLLALDYSRQLSTFIETKLTEREREVLVRYARGYSYSEIAFQLGITAKAVDGAIQRVRKKMAAGIDEPN